jgi:VWFA-related protein
VTSRICVLALLAVASAAARSQQPPPPAAVEPPLTQTLNVIVEADDGRLVPGLRASEFKLSVDGTPQPIDGVAARAAGPRAIALLLDEFHVGNAETAEVREATHRFIEEQVRDRDRVVVLKPLDSLPAIHLTADRNRVHDAVNAFDGRRGNYEPRSPLEEQTIGRSPALAEASRAQIVLSGLRALASRLGGEPGRAGIILISEGFTRDARLANARVLPGASAVERFANRSDVPVFAIDPITGPSDDPGEMTLRQLAAQTGGFFQSGGDIATALRRASAELDGGYVLTFRMPHGADGRFHSVTVQSTRRHTTVRSRAGYIAPLPPSLRAEFARDTAPPVTTRLQHRSPFIDVWSGVTRFVNAEGQVVVTWEPGHPFGLTAADVARVTLTATQPNGTVLYNGELAPVRAGVIRSDLTNRAAFNAPPGRVYLDLTILGTHGQKLDIDARDLEVPAAGPVPQLLPPAIVAARSAREFREAAANADTPPDPGRDFSRTTRLLIRVPVAGGTHSSVSARLVNRLGQTLRTIAVMPGAIDGVSEFDLPLAPFAPGDYVLLVTATSDKSVVEQRVPIKITG